MARHLFVCKVTGTGLPFEMRQICMFVLAATTISTANGHPDPADKPTGKLVLGGSKYGDCNDCTLRASPTMLKGDDAGEAWVSVRVQGVAFGQATDWVGAFSPNDISPEGALLRFPVRWQSAAKTCVPRGQAAPTPVMAPSPVPDPSQGSCASQGCSNKYDPSLPCSCTSECHKYNECCSDYDAVCGSKPACIGDACCTANNYSSHDLHGGGNATLNFKLVNLHAEYVFALVQGSAQFPAVVAISNAVSFARPAEPTGVHLATTGRPRQMRVTWSAPPGSAAGAYPSAVRWGTAAGGFGRHIVMAYIAMAYSYGLRASSAGI